MKQSNLLLCFLLCLLACTEDEIETFDNLTTKPQERSVLTRQAADGVYDLLGFSYDVTGKYLDVDAAYRTVVDLSAFVRDYPDRVYNPASTSGDTYTYAGATADSFLQEIKSKNSISLGANGQIDGLTLSGTLKVNEDLSQKYSYSTKYSFARGDVIKRVKRLYFDANPEMLSHYLTTAFISNLNSLSPDEFVSQYGTHVLCDITIGGRLSFTYRSVITEETTTTNKKIIVEAGLKFGISKFGADASNSHENEGIKILNSKNANWDLWISYKGGEGSGTSVTYNAENGYPTTTFNRHTWESSVNSKNAYLLEINWEKAYPIYDFISDPIKKQQIKDAVIRYIESKKVEVMELTPLYALWWAKGSNNHFATSWNEVVRYIGEGHTYGGVFGYINKKVGPDMSTLYALWWAKGSNTHYVTTWEEVNKYVKEGHSYGGILGYINKKPSENTLPVYSLWWAKGSNTHYVTTWDEVNKYLKEGRSYGGILGYVYPAY